MSMINNYPIFEDNQVLTSGQLNQLHLYLDQQNRLTRSCLIGMGIACGLEVEVNTGPGTAVIINEGIGISSEGFLMKLCPESGSCTTVQYRDYTLPEGVVYAPFQQDVDLYELLTAEVEIDEDDQLTPLTENFLNDKVVVLFLECLDNDLKSCLGKSCDELGIDRIFNLRKLLISTGDLRKVNARFNGGRQDDLFIQKNGLKDISLPRVFFDEINTAHYFPFAFSYVEAMTKVYEPLRTLLNSTYTVYEPILSKVYGENPFETSAIQNAFRQLAEYLAGGLTQPSWWGVQYVYDFFKDLILAYGEFKDCAYDLMLQCCPDMTRFPRHLMLGRAIDEQLARCEIDVFKHSFTQPPIYNNQGHLLEKTISLHKRMVLLLEKFSFDRLQNAEKMAPKITPSCEKKEKLSLRSIPFYYDSKSASVFDTLENLEIEWNFSRNHRQCQLFEKESNALTLSYDNNTMLPQAKTPLSTPLHFDIDPLNFLRLEGFQGKKLKEAVTNLNAIKEKANIDFDIKTIYFGDDLAENQILECFFNDLQPDYEIWRGKLLYFLDVFARFTNVSRFLSTQKVTGKATGKYAAVEALGTEPLYEELNTLRNMNVGLNSKNWANALDEVYYNTKNVNMGRWASKRNEKVTLRRALSDKPSVEEIHEEIRNCIIKIRGNSPENLGQFKMADWLPAYKCPLDLYVELVKLIGSKIPRDTNTSQMNTYMKLYCALHEILRNLFLYPYIDIRIIWNTVQNRIDQYARQHGLFQFYKDHPGLEHKAGVEQGQTFVLLYQANYSEKSQELLKKQMSAFLDANKKIPLTIEDAFGFEKEQLGKVVGDFTLPYKCCDPCSDMQPQIAQLHPIALPICEVVPIREVVVTKEEKRLEYLLLKEKLFHTMYEPERYRAILTSEAKFGKAELQFYPFEYDASKNIEGFAYQVDINKVVAAAKNSESAYLIDSIDYEIRHAETQEKIDGASITVVVPIIFQIDSQPIGLKGMVYAPSASGGQIPIPEAEVWVDVNGVKISDITEKDGIYELRDSKLVNGSYTLRTSATGYNSTVMTDVKVNNEIVEIDIQLKPLPKFGVDVKVLLDYLKLKENSSRAILINEEFKKSEELYKGGIERSIEAEKDNAKSLMAAAETISRFSDDETLTAAELNVTYASNRDMLLEEIDSTKSRLSKTNRSNAFKILTNSYMDRLILKEPGKLTATSVKTLTETAKLIAKSRIAMKDNFGKWANRKEKVVGKAIIARITKNFKLS